MQLLHWVLSDDQLRTDDEIVTEMVSILGFSRRGARIEAAIKTAIQLHRAATVQKSRS
jgi:Arc/MetJ family transcription regulator